tara:strand:+ start:672 stop:1154 length:483 start_codon:yes stop_codon:yes gene_type:complete
MAPSIRVSPEAYKGLRKMIDASYANTISGVIDRFLEEEGVMPEEENAVSDTASGIENGVIEEWTEEVIEEAEGRGSSFSREEQDEIIDMLGDSVCNYRYQRDAMRGVFEKYNGDKNKSIRAYAWLEENSYAPRKNNTHGFGAMYYAEALYNDGIKKGWLK